MCGHALGRFLPYGRGLVDSAPLSLALEVVGSDVENMECPWCGSTDRERHLQLYLQRTGLLSWLAGKRVLHLAPEKRLAGLLLDGGPALYAAADLAGGPAVDLRFDLAQMPFPDAAFDLVVANHVLEHVHALPESLSELHRVLAPGGLAILQTPFSPVLHTTFEDTGIEVAEARFHAYGQDDHVRLFGRDIASIIELAGFTSKMNTHQEVLADVQPADVGVNPEEPFFLFERC
jgi:SAM-dependent methyltransferase